MKLTSVRSLGNSTHCVSGALGAVLSRNRSLYGLEGGGGVSKLKPRQKCSCGLALEGVLELWGCTQGGFLEEVTVEP